MKYMVVFVLCKNGVVRKDRGAFLTAAKKGQPWQHYRGRTARDDTSTGRLSLRKLSGASQSHIPEPEGPDMLGSPALWQKTSLSVTSIVCGYGIRRFPIPRNSSRPNVNNRQVRVYRRSRQELLPYPFTPVPLRQLTLLLEIELISHYIFK